MKTSVFNSPLVQRSLLYRVLSLVFEEVDFLGMEHYSFCCWSFFQEWARQIWTTTGALCVYDDVCYVVCPIADILPDRPNPN